MLLPLAALMLAALGFEAAGGSPDYTGTMSTALGAPVASIRSHAGVVRMDFPRPRNEVESEYQAPDVRSVVVTVRDSRGQVTLLWIRPLESWTQPEALAWQDERPRTIAGENCASQYSPRGALRRCLTADGVNLLPSREGRSMQMLAFTRGPVDPRQVAPPLELLDLRRWAGPSVGALQPHPRQIGDYQAVFARRGRTVRRSGAWTSTVEAGSAPAASVVNDLQGVEIKTSGTGPDELWLRRFSPGARWGAFGFQAATVAGHTEEHILGETCRWRSRSTTPDSRDVECRTDDDALLAVGSEGMGGIDWEPAASFRREPVPLAAILPAPDLLRPERYGLPLPPAARADR